MGRGKKKIKLSHIFSFDIFFEIGKIFEQTLL
jgi:hypothetical protein